MRSGCDKMDPSLGGTYLFKDTEVLLIHMFLYGRFPLALQLVRSTLAHTTLEFQVRGFIPKHML